MIKIDKHDFDIADDQDEIRVDGLCRELLREFHCSLPERGVPPLEAGALAHGADYYLRDFLVAALRANPFSEAHGMVRRFAATWYITSNLEPNIGELVGYLEGVRELYRFLHRGRLISAPFMAQVELECGDIPYYEQRIDTFLAITGDGYYAWAGECTLKTGGGNGTP